MNLAVTPVKFNNYSATQNSQQNFEGLQARLLTHSSETPKSMLNTRTVTHRDMIIDRVMYHLEETAKKIGLNIDALEKKGISIDFIPEESYSTRMTAFVKNKDGNVVQNADSHPLFARVKRGNESDQGENLAHDLKGLNLDTEF